MCQNPLIRGPLDTFKGTIYTSATNRNLKSTLRDGRKQRKQKCGGSEASFPKGGQKGPGASFVLAGTGPAARVSSVTRTAREQPARPLRTELTDEGLHWEAKARHL